MTNVAAQRVIIIKLIILNGNIRRCIWSGGEPVWSIWCAGSRINSVTVMDGGGGGRGVGNMDDKVRRNGG